MTRSLAAVSERTSARTAGASLRRPDAAVLLTQVAFHMSTRKRKFSSAEWRRGLWGSPPPLHASLFLPPQLSFGAKCQMSRERERESDKGSTDRKSRLRRRLLPVGIVEPLGFTRQPVSVTQLGSIPRWREIFTFVILQASAVPAACHRVVHC